jgi:hypothetical protein
MTSRMRSRVKFCLILGLLTLPAEALLLPVARTPKADEAALEWAADLSPQQLVAPAMRLMPIRSSTARRCSRR